MRLYVAAVASEKHASPRLGVVDAQEAHASDVGVDGVASTATLIGRATTEGGVPVGATDCSPLGPLAVRNPELDFQNLAIT